MQNRLRLFAAAAAAFVLASCDNPAAPREVPEDQLTFVRAAADAPPLAYSQVSVWVKQSQGGRIEIPYLKVGGGYGGDECMEFIIPGNSLRTRPDGSAIAPADSVLITVNVVDASQFNFQFSPSGLKFDPKRPAELRISYKWANPDLNGDGKVDDADRNFRFGIFKQEATGLPWVPIGTVKDTNVEELRATINGFTKYAMAGG